ncbi:MAG: TetR/AcrR family transcriptional regulator [Gemmatimonadota bacterium]
MKKRLRRRDEILHSALLAFREKGYHGTTLEDIAGRLGLRKTALYHYFPDKESILYECHRRSLSELERVLDEARTRYDTATERLGQVIREHVRVMTELLQGSPLAFEVPALSREHQAEVVARRDRYEMSVRKLVAEGVEAGEFRPVDPKIATLALLGAINWIARWYDPDGSMSAPELGARFAEHLVGGLALSWPPAARSA